MKVEIEAKSDVIRGLNAVASDIETAAFLMDQLLFAQSTAVESIAAQVQLVQFRLQSMKEQQQAQELDSMKDQTSTTLSYHIDKYPVPSHIVDISQHSADMEVVVNSNGAGGSEGGTFEKRYCDVVFWLDACALVSH